MSFILASLLSLSQIAPCLAISQKAYASTDKVEKEITSNIDHNLEDGNKNQDNIEVDTSLKNIPLQSKKYPDGSLDEKVWVFTINNNSDKAVYLGEILTPVPASNSPVEFSKNIYVKRFKVNTYDLYEEDYLRKFIFDIIIKEPNKGERKKFNYKLLSDIPFYDDRIIDANFKFRKTLEIPAKKSIDIEISTVFFYDDYMNPFDKGKWMRKGGNDNNCLFNTDHAMSLKANLYYDKDGKEPIRKEDLPQDSKFNDQASGNFQLKAEVGDLRFGDANKKPSKVFIKKSGEEDYNSTEKAKANTNDTLRFVVPVKISNAKDAYQAALKKAGHKQYLINPRFLVQKEEDDDSSLYEEFYIRKTADDPLVKLDKIVVKEGGKEYFKLTLPANKTSEFMTEFDFVYDVKFKDSQRTHGLNKKVKLDFDNLGNVISYNGDLTIDLKADYLNATEVYYQVDFDMANHGKIKSQSVKKGQTASEPEEPKAEGYSFEGWYSDNKFENEFKFDEPITKDTTIYAKWAKLFDITYEFVSGSEGNELPASINELLKKIENKKYKVGETVKAPDIKFEPVKADGGTWTFEAWDKKEIVVSENSATNKFAGKWTLAKENQPQPGKNDTDGKGNDTHGPKPGENTGNKDKENSDNPKDHSSDKKEDAKDKDKKDSEKPSLKPLDTDAPKERVIRVNTDIHRPIPKGYKRIYFDPGKDACLKYNPTFDYGEIIAFDVKETMTFGEAKAEDKGLVIPIAIPKDKSLKFVGWSPKLQANGEFVEGVKYVAIYEKIDKAQDNDGKKSDENKATKNEEKQKENPSKDGKDLTKANKNKKLIADGEISKKENVKTQNALPNKAKAVVNKYTSPRTGVAGLGLVSGILALSSAGLYFSKKTKKD